MTGVIDEEVPVDITAVVAILTDWRLVRPFTCTARQVQRVEDVETTFDLHVDPTHTSFVGVDRESGREWSYDDASRVTVSAGSVVPWAPHQIWSPPPIARLAFPLTLPIWGRRHDAFVMSSAQERDARIYVSLDGIHRWTGYGGELVIDIERGLSVSLTIPDQIVQYTEIQRARALSMGPGPRHPSPGMDG